MKNWNTDISETVMRSYQYKRLEHQGFMPGNGIWERLFQHIPKSGKSQKSDKNTEKFYGEKP
jgi:hypothetical protein